MSDVLHVPEIRKNLISGSLLSKHGFKLTFVADKFVLSKNEVYVGRGYVCDGLFKENISTIIPNNDMNKTISSAYMVDSSNIWHSRLGHVNFYTLRKLINLDYIPKCRIDSKYKCQICDDTKLTRTFFHHVERETEPLDLIHTDVCELKMCQTRGGKRYFITFIDDCTRYCYVYLLTSKDEAFDMFKQYKAEVKNQLNKKIKALRSDREYNMNSPSRSSVPNMVLYTKLRLHIHLNPMA